MIAGRSVQLQYLNEFYKKEGSHILVVYGQKHIGKTTLMREFIGNKPSHYFMVRACSEKEQLGKLNHDWFGQEEQSVSFRELFMRLNHTCVGNDKYVIVIDEFHSLVKVSYAFTKALAGFLKKIQHESRFLFILVSSSVSFIEHHMVKKMGECELSLSGLYKLKELSFAAMEAYFKRWSRQECLKAYAVLGGVPGLWTYFDDRMSVMENICYHMVDPHSFLNKEAKRMVEEELREVSVYQTLLSALSAGRQKLNELYLYTGFSRAKISVYLKNLMDLGLVEKIFSIDSAGRDQTQKGLYRICSRYVLFYYTYLFDCEQALFSESAEEYCTGHIMPEFPGFLKTCFRDVCRQYLEQEGRQGNLPIMPQRFGEWVGKTGCIDIVASGEGEYLLGCSYYEEEQMPFKAYEQFQNSIRVSKIVSSCNYLFAREGFDERIQLEAEKDKRIKLLLFHEL